jgi:hypothetical protein
MISGISLRKIFIIISTSFILSVLILIGLTLISCNAIEEFLNMEILEIKSYTPSSERINHDLLNQVSITFSEEMDRSRTEGSFSLKKNASPVNGKYSWNKNTILFSPFNGFSKNESYMIEVSTEAEDRYGNSLPEKFIFSFSTSDETELPFFISSNPEDKAVITDPLIPVTLIFSEPLSSDSVYSSISIRPQIKGHIALSDGSRIIVFTPLEKYEEGSDYTVTVTEDLRDLSGNHTAEKLEIYFTMQDTDKPNLIWLGDSSGAEYQDTENLMINLSIEKDIKIRLVYDREITEKIKKAPVKIYPETEYTASWNTEITEAAVSFKNNLEYNEIYEITADEKTYRLIVNGPSSKPPELNKITFCNDSSSPVFEEMILNKGINFLTSASAFFDFYFSLAEGASLYDSDIFTSIGFKTVNGDLSVKPLRIMNPASGLPAPSPSPSGDEYVIRIECAVTAGTVVSPFRIEISSGFKDTLSNKTSDDINMQVTSL